MVCSQSIVGVSDVSLGFGSTEVLPLMVSLAKHYRRNPIVFEPDEITRPPLVKPPCPGMSIERIPSNWETYSEPYRIEYVTSVARRINRIRPELLVIFCTFGIPVLFKLRHKPRFVIYHSYELVTKYGQFDIEMNRHASRMIDLIVFSEENRARIDTAACGYEGTQKVIAYNCGDLIVSEPKEPLPPDERNGKIIYYGTLVRRVALSEYFLDTRIQGIPIDLFGRIMEPTDEGVKELLAGIHGSIKYHGLVDAEDLVRLRREYAFSVVMWNPYISEGHYYVSPDRLFSSIQAGVPPIVAPHPQCKMIVDRYDCGIVMADWSFESFHDALKRAMKIYGTSRYADLVNNCVQAARNELNWNKQFEKIQRLLPSEL